MKLFDFVEFKENNIFQYIGIIVVIVFIIYLLLKMANTQMKVVEGLVGGATTSQPTQTPQSYMDLVASGDDKSLKTAIEKMKDILLIDKYRSDYEDVIINLEEVINQNLLYFTLTLASSVDEKSGLLNISDKESPNTISIQTLQMLNELYKYKDNLNSTMSYVDGK